MNDCPKVARLFFCAAIYIIAWYGVIWLASFFLVGWPSALYLATYAVQDLLLKLPQAFAFLIPLAGIELAALIWRSHSISKRRDGLLALLLAVTGAPTILFFMTAYTVLEAYIQHHYFWHSLMPTVFSLALCVPIFFTSLILLARGTKHSCAQGISTVVDGESTRQRRRCGL